MTACAWRVLIIGPFRFMRGRIFQGTPASWGDYEKKMVRSSIQRHRLREGAVASEPVFLGVGRRPDRRAAIRDLASTSRPSPVRLAVTNRNAISAARHVSFRWTQAYRGKVFQIPQALVSLVDIPATRNQVAQYYNTQRELHLRLHGGGGRAMQSPKPLGHDIDD